MQMSLSTTHTVFVYGTLKKSECRADILSASVSICKRSKTAHSYHMYYLVRHGYPFISKQPIWTGNKHQVTGEVYMVTSALLDKLDDIEGHPRLFCRELIAVETEHGTVDAWTYFLANRNMLDAFASTDPKPELVPLQGTFSSADWAAQ